MEDPFSVNQDDDSFMYVSTIKTGEKNMPNSGIVQGAKKNHLFS
jgi:hypothetical protein